MGVAYAQPGLTAEPFADLARSLAPPAYPCLARVSVVMVQQARPLAEARVDTVEEIPQSKGEKQVWDIYMAEIRGVLSPLLPQVIISVEAGDS